MIILVPTDFSKQGQIAVDLAVQIAPKVGVELLFYHCIEDLPQGWMNWPSREGDQDIQYQNQVAESDLILSKISNSALHKGIVNKTLITTGPFLENLHAVINQHQIELVIMGTHGVSGKQEYLIGSNAQKVIRRVHTNVLVVKESIDHITFEKVLFASDLGREDKNAFNSFLSFIRFFDTQEIHLLTIDTPGFISQPRALVRELQNDFQSMAAGYDCKTHFVSNFTVEGGIRKFSQDLGIDLIGISNYQKHPIKRIFSGSNVEMLANHAAVPVLSLDSAED